MNVRGQRETLETLLQAFRDATDARRKMEGVMGMERARSQKGGGALMGVPMLHVKFKKWLKLPYSMLPLV